MSLTIKICRVIPILLLLATSVNAQHKVWEKWDDAIIEEANTANDFDDYTEEEKKVVFFMNLARINGPLFAETILNAYIEEYMVERTANVESLFNDLRNLEKMSVLYPEDDLTGIAVGHAEESGRTGETGHKNFDERFEPYLRNPYWGVAENCSYGPNEALEIVMNLLIDEGVPSLGHRKNILDAEFNSVGVAIRDHKEYNTNCVIDFGKKNRSTLNDVPF